MKNRLYSLNIEDARLLDKIIWKISVFAKNIYIYLQKLLSHFFTRVLENSPRVLIMFHVCAVWKVCGYIQTAMLYLKQLTFLHELLRNSRIAWMHDVANSSGIVGISVAYFNRVILDDDDYY